MSAKGNRVVFAKREDVPRRRFLGQGLALLGAGVALSRERLAGGAPGRDASPLPIRPPGASADDVQFRKLCTRCGLCGTVCENGCIRYTEMADGHGGLTPYIDVRARSCTLCMRCTQICPTGALKPIEFEPQAILDNVKMGRAEVDPEHCISYLGRLCGYCHDACPITEHAIKLTSPALPVILDGCIGCGRCVEQCPQEPTAIRIVREEKA